VLLHRYSGQADFCLGASVANRSRPELESLIGLFSNMLVLRADFAGHPSFAEFMARMQSVSVGAQEHQDLPFEKLVEELNPPRDRSYSPYFQVILILHNMPSGKWEVPGLEVRNMGLDFGTAKSDLALHITEEGGGMEAAFEYSTDLFERPSIERMAGHFTALLEAVVANPNCPVSELPLLAPAEERALAAWGEAGGGCAAEGGLLHELFEAQARRHPQRVALSCGGQSLSYAELDARAGRLAEDLRRRGVGAEARVGLCLERSAEAVVAMLAVLKAGGAYVPLDPGYPPERLAELLADSAAVLLLSQAKLAARLPAGLPTVYLDGEGAPAGGVEAQAAPSAVPASNLQAAYLIYTSGSTGKPKGVVVSHANAVASTAARFAYYAEPPDCFLLLSPFAFDSSVAGIFWTLAQGGRLCVSPEGSQQDPRTLLKIIERERPSHLLCLPSLHGLLLDCAQPGQMEALRHVIVAGESCAPALAAQHFQRLPGTRLHNEYGPTEATVWSSVHPVQPGDGQADRPVSIGRPVAGARLRILDGRLNPVPAGVPGEIYVGGAGVARAYHRRPGLSAERFVPDPFGPPGQRLYRTGDLARWREDGSVEFLGRADGQVKIRGFRVELGEIEARLLRHPQVKEAAAAIREDVPGDFRIVAYVVLSAAEAQAGLREFLKESLPDYMVPSAFVALERLPLTLTGKLDRAALPKPDLALQLAEGYSAPQSATEQQLCGIWAELLGVEPVGVHDNFFDLGGHSLSAVQVVTRIEDRMGLEISVADLFDAPTVAELAQVLAKQAGGREADELDAILRELQDLPDGEAEALLAGLSD
jgi:amino acid adenylation domain-containing protein